MKLPNGTKAELGDKLEKYLLNPLHRHGQHKARMFASVLGITLSNIEVLKAGLHEAAAETEEATPMGDNGYGKLYVVRFSLSTDKGTATVLSAWIVRYGEDFPRLTTCYIV